MKDTYYFPHDYDSTSDPKIQSMIGEYGATGYGLFWRIIEMLHSDSEHKLPKKQYIYLALAKQMSTSVEQVSTFVEQCISLFELFESDDRFIWSNRVNRNISKRIEISESRSKAGKTSAEKRKNSTNVEQMLTGVEQTSTKERREKEIKVKESKGEIDGVPPSTTSFDKSVVGTLARRKLETSPSTREILAEQERRYRASPLAELDPID